MSNYAELHEGEHHEEHPGYGFFTAIWIGLIALTGLTVAIAGVDMGMYTVPIALLIACIKSMLVLNYFMHVKFDNILVKVFAISCGVIIALILIFLGSDVFIGGS